ncbi:hypothetical protein ABT009_46765 [Streptomyces sp. NPDC002896]|uniref:hypothetical protein n=1 Tax=Streptomyces sp. NPDC002896 TaxID=3154438 RepID=UPI00332832E9
MRRAGEGVLILAELRISHAGPPRIFATLEEQMTTYVGASEHEEKSPDLLDSCEWALTDLFLDAMAAGATAPSSDGRLAGRR